MPSQWTYHLDQCPNCAAFSACESRRRILATVSEQTYSLNSAANGCAVGSIYVQCQRANVAPQCTASLTRCQSCPQNESCPDRAALQAALSDLCRDLNAATDATGGATTIVVNCVRG